MLLSVATLFPDIAKNIKPLMILSGALILNPYISLFRAEP